MICQSSYFGSDLKEECRVDQSKIKMNFADIDCEHNAIMIIPVCKFYETK